VSNRWAFFLAVGSPRYAGVGGPSHAESDAAALAKTLATVGYPPSRQLMLCGPDATKAVVESKAKAFAKRMKKGDRVLMFVAARRFDLEGSVHFACWDTLPEDPAGTGLRVGDVFDTLSPARIGSAVAFVDLTDGPAIPGTDDVPAVFPTTVPGLASCEWGETSHAVGTPPRGLWASLVIESLTADKHLSTVSLRDVLVREFPRRLRAAFGPGTVQTPTTFGPDADVPITEAESSDGPGPAFDASRIARIVFRGESRSRFKDLAGYRKSFATPDRVTASANKFAARVAGADVEKDLGETFDRVVREYGYKRRDVSVSTDRDGTGVLRTPDFEYLVTVTLDPAEPTTVVWHREVGQFADTATVRSPAFNATFGRVVDRLAFEFESPWDVAGFVDRFEDRPTPGTTVKPSPDGSTCEVRFAGLAGAIELSKSGLVVRGKPGAPGDLLAALFHFFGATTPAERPALPAKSRKRP
jgi:hypothetical protein